MWLAAHGPLNMVQIPFQRGDPGCKVLKVGGQLPVEQPAAQSRPTHRWDIGSSEIVHCGREGFS